MEKLGEMHVLMFPTIVNGPFGLDMLRSNQKAFF